MNSSWRYRMWRPLAKVVMHSQVTTDGAPPRDLFITPRVYRSAYDIIPGQEVFNPAQILYTEPLLSMPGAWQATFDEVALIIKRVRRMRQGVALKSVIDINATALNPVDETPVVAKKLFNTIPFRCHEMARRERMKVLLTAAVEQHWA